MTMPIHIAVDYPTVKYTKIPKTEEQVMRERIYARTMDVEPFYLIPTKVNEEQYVQVRTVASKIEDEFKSNEDRCVEQTGMTSSAYQAKYKRAWNE